MTEFLNYKVNLTLRDGSKSSGLIANVDSNHITLQNVSDSSRPQQSVPHLTFNSSNIADLKVVQLPPDLLKSNKLKNIGKGNGFSEIGGGGNNISEAAMLDEAILFAKASTPMSGDSNNIKEKPYTNNTVARPYQGREGTPKSRAPKSANRAISTDSSEPVWGQENEILDIKASTDFDFAASLAMFDKESVFADFQKTDTVNPSERLVGHNKLESSQKPKKEKYGNDEMVLDTNKADKWDAIENAANPKGRFREEFSQSPSPANNFKRERVTSSEPKNFKLASASKATIPSCSTVQLLEIERLASDSYGVTPAITSEVCAANLSRLIIDNVLGGASRLGNQSNHNLPPLVLLLIGSGRCGSRAFATGRHLSNHGVRVLAFVISNDESDLDLSQQWNLFVSCGGKIITSNFGTLLKIINQELDTPVELIIDALQGYDDHLEDIFYQEEDQQELRQIINWGNEHQQQSKIMSLDIPSGIDGGSGTVPNASLKLSCRWCVSMGFPIAGIIHAYKNGHLTSGQDGEILHYLIDIGIPNKVYTSKPNLRKFDKFWFGSDSILKLDVTTV